MVAVRPLPRTGSIFFDARGADRALRVSWHEEEDLVVVSLWRDNVCTGSFRLAADDVPDLVDTLVDSLRQRGLAAPARPLLGDVG
jgi:hypothetical protein